MKKILLLVLCGIYLNNVSAQVNIAHDTVYLNGVPKNNTTVECKDSIINNTSSNVAVNWSKLSQYFPNGWSLVNICDPSQCRMAPADGNYNATIEGPVGRWYVGVKAAPGADDGPAWVTLTTNYGNMTFIFNTWPTSLNDKEVSSFVSVYPNPTSSVINVVLNNKSISAMNVLNVIGRKVATVAVDATKPSLKYSLNHLPDGIYILQFVDAKGKLVGVKKVTKN